jgi:hypothetical protein
MAMDGSDECFSVVHGEGIHLRPIRFAKTGTPKVQSWVFMDRSVSISELECPLQDADGVVVGLLTPVVPICDAE